MKPQVVGVVVDVALAGLCGDANFGPCERVAAVRCGGSLGAEAKRRQPVGSLWAGRHWSRER